MNQLHFVCDTQKVHGFVFEENAVMVHFGHNHVWDVRLTENNKAQIGTFREVFAKAQAIPASLDLLNRHSV